MTVCFSLGALVLADEKPTKAKPKPEDFLGKWSGKWDDKFQVRFTARERSQRIFACQGKRAEAVTVFHRELVE